MQARPLTVAWFSYFPVEWLPDVPEAVARLPRLHPATWQRVLLGELEGSHGLRLHIIVLRKQFERDTTFERNGVTFHLIKTPGGLRATTFYWLDTWLIRRKLAAIRPDVVHAWGTEQGAALVANRLGYPALVTIQGLMSWIEQVVPLNWHDRLAAMLERYSLPRARVVSTESNFPKDWLRKRFPGLRVEQVEHVPAWLFHQVARQPQLQPLRFLFVGAFEYRRGADVLLAALDQLKDELAFELVVVRLGETVYATKLRQVTSAGLWQRIQFRNRLSAAEVAEEMSRATLMIMPTRVDTGPVAVKEAVVAGLPVVASAVGGINDYILPGRNGLLFPAGNLEECVKAVRAACQHPLFSRGLVEPAALAEMRVYLSPQRMAEKFLALYQELGRFGKTRIEE